MCCLFLFPFLSLSLFYYLCEILFDTEFLHLYAQHSVIHRIQYAAYKLRWCIFCLWFMCVCRFYNCQWWSTLSQATQNTHSHSFLFLLVWWAILCTNTQIKPLLCIHMQHTTNVDNVPKFNAIYGFVSVWFVFFFYARLNVSLFKIRQIFFSCSILLFSSLFRVCTLATRRDIVNVLIRQTIKLCAFICH